MKTNFMRAAIRLSLEKMRRGEGGPFGAVVVRRGKIVGRGWNRVTSTNDPTAHAEVTAIREALRAFDKQIRGFAMDDALLTGVETRTSSPLRVTRNAHCQSVNTRGLYPAGEGAGYAGGILSAAVDGIEVAEALALNIVGKR